MHCLVHRCSVSLDNLLSAKVQVASSNGLIVKIVKKGETAPTVRKEDGEFELRQVEELSDDS